MMARLTLRILTMRTTSATNKRAFNARGIEERRTCFKAKTVDALLLLQNYQKNMKKVSNLTSKSLIYVHY